MFLEGSSPPSGVGSVSPLSSTGRHCADSTVCSDEAVNSALLYNIRKFQVLVKRCDDNIGMLEYMVFQCDASMALVRAKCDASMAFVRA